MLGEEVVTAKSVTIPARPYLGWGGDEVRQVEDVVEAWLDQTLGGTPMTIREVLEEQLAGRLRAALPGLKAVDVWDGAWDALASPKRHSFHVPAALVSLTGLALVHRGQQGFHPRQLQRGETPPSTPQVRIDVAVTFVSADPSAPQRASEVLGLAEAAVPLLLDAALEDIRGTNLYAKALYEAGMSAFALLGGRTVELVPEHPEPQLPETVRARGRVGYDGVVWEGDG